MASVCDGLQHVFVSAVRAIPARGRSLRNKVMIKRTAGTPTYSPRTTGCTRPAMTAREKKPGRPADRLMSSFPNTTLVSSFDLCVPWLPAGWQCRLLAGEDFVAQRRWSEIGRARAAENRHRMLSRQSSAIWLIGA